MDNCEGMNLNDYYDYLNRLTQQNEKKSPKKATKQVPKVSSLKSTKQTSKSSKNINESVNKQEKKKSIETPKSSSQIIKPETNVETKPQVAQVVPSIVQPNNLNNLKQYTINVPIIDTTKASVSYRPVSYVDIDDDDDNDESDYEIQVMLPYNYGLNSYFRSSTGYLMNTNQNYTYPFYN